MSQQDLFQLFEQRPIHSVSQVVHRAQVLLETEFRDLWIQGEVSNFRRPASGHFYFTLKDPDAQLRAVCFRLQNRYLKFQPEDGMEVLARGTLTVYGPRGEFQLVVEYMEPVGRGALQLAFEQLKRRLAAEGLFDVSRKKKLPLLPAKIGLLTSPSGAALQDILRVLRRRNNRLQILIYPVQVQGPGAAKAMVDGLAYLNRRPDVDVILLARGGGSWEDLWAFNEESLARAICASEKPVISAVGHEIDFTIADFVADVRAATPSAAAELVCRAQQELLEQIAHLEKRCVQAVRLLIRERRQSLIHLSSSRAFMDAHSRLRLLMQRLDDLHSRLQQAFPLLLRTCSQRRDQWQRELRRQLDRLLQAHRGRLTLLASQLQAYSPLAVLERGYAIASREDGEIIRSPAQLSGGEPFLVQVAQGRFRARKEP